MAKADVEELVIAWLNSIVGTGWVAYGDKPKTVPSQFITVDRTGGPRESMVLDRAEILIEVYCKTSRKTAKDKANDIADRIVELEIYSNDITHASINSVVHLDDILISNTLKNTTLVKRITKLQHNNALNKDFQHFKKAFNHINGNTKYKSDKFSLRIEDEKVIIADDKIRFEIFLYLCDSGVVEDIVNNLPFLIKDKESLK